MRFTEGYCKVCGKPSDKLRIDTPVCPDCFRIRSRHYHRNDSVENKNRLARGLIRRVRAKAEIQYTEWITKLTSVDTHTLTEDEWLAACTYFKGCAICGGVDISARSYFIPFAAGGRYNACNVLPCCEQCATSLKKQPNPFIRFNKVLCLSSTIIRGAGADTLAKIVDYLDARLQEVINER